VADAATPVRLFYGATLTASVRSTTYDSTVYYPCHSTCGRGTL